MVHKVRLYGNLEDRTWRIDEEPDPEPRDGRPWMLVAPAEFESEADVPYPLILQQ